MKKTQIIDLISTIKKTCASFIAISLFVAMAVAIFTGLSWSIPGGSASLDRSLEKGNAADIDILYPLGLDSVDLEVLSQCENVREVEGLYSANQVFRLEEDSYQAKIISLTKTINTPLEVEGMLPVDENQIAVEAYWAKAHDVAIGDTIVFDPDNASSGYAIQQILAGDEDALNSDDGEKTGSLKSQEFIVTALMEHPAYLSNMSYTYGANYSNSTPLDCLMFVAPEAFNKKAFDGFTEVYITGTQFDGMSTFGDEYSQAVEKFAEDLDETIQFLALRKANRIEIAGKKLANNLYEDLDSAVATLDASQAEIDDGREALEGMKKQAEAMHTDAYDEAIAEMEAQLDDAQAKIDEGLADVESGRKDVHYFRDSVVDLTGVACSVLTLKENAAVTIVEAAKTSSNSLRLVMSALFTLVGLLVCFSAIRRLVHEQIVQIGTKKALGFRRGELRRFQLSYTGIALIFGCIFGLLIGRFIVEPLVIFAMKTGLLFDEIVCVATVPEAVLICGVEIVVLLLITLIACASLLKRNAIDLLAGETPAQGKQRFYEKLAVWDRLSLLSKTIVNNCFNDPRRIFATVVGIMGCTALMLTSFTLLFNLKNSLTFQFDELYHFDSIVFVDADVDGANEQVESVLDGQGARFSPIHYSRLSIDLPDGTTSMSEMFVPLDDSFNKFVTMQNLDGEAVQLDKGLWLWAAAKNTSGVEVGDTVEVTDVVGVSHDVTVEGICRYYLNMQQSFITAEGYEHEFDLDADKNAYLVDCSQCDIANLKKALNGTEGFYLFYDYRSAAELTFNIMSIILYAMVGVYLLLSIVVAVLVIYNLLIMFINEKRRDLIVMMINGVSIKQAKRYIYSDTIFLSVIGIVLGCILGDIAGKLAIVSLCNEIMYYLSNTVAIAWALGTVLTAVTLFIMTKVALKRIEKFNLTDINRF